MLCDRCGTSNPAPARFCLACGAALAAMAETLDSHGTRRPVSILFCDLVGSTTLGEQVDAEVVRSVLARYFAAMVAVIESHGGTVEKYIGDAIMAVFGLPRIHEDDALRAVRAAVGMRAALATLNGELAADRALTLEARTGIATGVVVAGTPVGGGTLVTGDVVNTAARVEQAAGPGEILVTEATWRLTRDAVVGERVPSVSAKGKAAPVAVVRVLSLAADRHGTRGVTTDRGRLMGRDPELDVLDAALASARATRRGRIAVVAGSAGIGKSRLIGAWVARLGDAATVLHGRCLSYGDGITWWALRGILHAAAGITEQDSGDDARARLFELGGEDPDGPLVASRLASLIGLSAAAVPAEELGWAVRRVVERLAALGPLVLVIEDIHWADAALLDLLEQVARQVRDAGVLIVCSSRPELRATVSSWPADPSLVTWLRLDPLDAAATAALVDDIPGAAALPSGLRQRAIAIAEGNPLFLEELVRMLVEDGPRGDDPVPLPPTIGALLAARLDSLPAGERGTAQRASVVGRAFEAAMVAALSPDALRAGVSDAILGLVRRELVLPDSGDGRTDGRDPADAYRFRHILIRDAAYEALTKTERASLHERFADQLEIAAGDRLAEYEAILGHHLERAYTYRMELRDAGPATLRLGERAARRLHASAVRARALDDWAAAVELGMVAEPLPVPDPGFRAELLFDLGFALRMLGRLEEALACLRRSLDQAVEAGDLRVMARARVLAVESRVGSGQLMELDAEARSERERALGEAEASGDARAQAEVWNCLSEQAWNEGDFGRSWVELQRAVEHADRAEDPWLVSELELGLLVYGVTGPTPAGQVARSAELAADRAMGFPSVRMLILAKLAIAEAMLGRAGDARRHLEEAFVIAHELGSSEALAELHLDRWWVEWLAGDGETAEAAARAGCMGQASESRTAFAMCRLAEQLLVQGRLEEARVALSACEVDPLPLLAPRLVGIRAVLLAADGDPGAREEIERALGLVRGTPYVNQLADLLSEAALAMRWLDDREAALRYAQDAWEVAQAKENLALAARIRTFLDELGP